MIRLGFKTIRKTCVAIIVLLIFVFFLRKQLTNKTDEISQSVVIAQKSNDTFLKAEWIYEKIRKKNYSKKYILNWKYSKWNLNDSGEDYGRCISTNNPHLLDNINDFDVIRFEYDIAEMLLKRVPRPATRSPDQQYLMAALE
jgi:hypothetical protein